MASMSLKKIHAIIVEAKSGGYYDGDLDQPDADLLRDAAGLVRQARRAHGLGNKAETIANILHIADSDDSDLPEVGSAPAEKAPEPEPDTQDDEPTSDAPTVLYSPDGSEVSVPTPAAAEAMLAAGFTVEPPAASSDEPAQEPEAEAPADETDTRREDALDEISRKVLKSYSLTDEDLVKLDIEDLEHMVSNPTGAYDDLPSVQRAAKEQAEQEEKDRTLAEAAAEAASKAEEKPKTRRKAPAKPAKEAIKESAVGRLDRERLPIPAELPDDQIPEMPFDMTKVGEQELISLHSRFHACEARANYLVSELGDEAADYGKLAEAKETEVRNSLDRDEYKLKDDIDAAVRSHAEVVALRQKEHDAKKELGRAKMLASNYHRDCERLRWTFFMLKGENPGSSDSMRR